ncbi:cytochrome-c oxidase [bacterium]|nr:cytochrome-c oxidase [bacterium]
MFERKSGILLVAGLIFFAFAFLSNAVVPALMYSHLPEKTAEELVNGNIRYQFEDLARRYPEAFVAAFGQPPEDPETKEGTDWWNQNVADALREGRSIYVGEGCWHCHSQFVRPVSNEEQRWGPVAASWEYQNELQRPVMFGTRRVGPDLSREGGRRSNDWHAVHFFKPTMVSHKSPMPEYPWLFDGSPSKPTRRGMALMTYVQWLGSWLESYPDYEAYTQAPLEELKKEAAEAAEAAPAG